MSKPSFNRTRYGNNENQLTNLIDGDNEKKFTQVDQD